MRYRHRRDARREHRRCGCYDRAVIRTVIDPFKEKGGIAVLRGNLCPDGAVIKPSAASPALMTHKGRAVVFESIEDSTARIDSTTSPSTRPA